MPLINTEEEGALRRVRAEVVRQMLTDVLTARERGVLTLRFGLDGEPPAPLTEAHRRLTTVDCCTLRLDLAKPFPDRHDLDSERLP